MIEITVITLVVLAIVFVAMGPKPSERPKDEKAKSDGGTGDDGDSAP